MDSRAMRPSPLLQPPSPGKPGRTPLFGSRSTGFMLLAALAAWSWLTALPFASPALANGGTVQISNQVAGPYQLTVLTSPNPIRVGIADVSVMVQRAGSSDLVQDTHVLVTATPIGREGRVYTFEATHEQATNKLYYAANVDLPSEGRWAIDVDVVGEMGEGTVSFEVEASQAGLMDNPLMLVGLLLLPLLLAGGWWATRTRGGAAHSAGESDSSAT